MQQTILSKKIMLDVSDKITILCISQDMNNLTVFFNVKHVDIKL